VSGTPHWLTWREATTEALYGPAGFFRRPEGPAGHFRTSSTASPLFAAALLRLADLLGVRTVVDVGAGRGELLLALNALAGDRLRLVGVELAERPPGLPPTVEWLRELPGGLDALLVGNEWLDNVPVDVVAVDGRGHARLVLVDPSTGSERIDGSPAAADLEWLATWWPLDAADTGDRAEVGRPRDEAWAAAVASLRSGAALAIDYGHLRAERRARRRAAGTLLGYRGGRAVPPVPDGSCDVTSHVALDACAAAGMAAGATASVLTSQRAALRALGVSGSRPPHALATSDPSAYVGALSTASQAGELLDPAGLGAFTWLLQAVGATALPGPLAALSSDRAAPPA